MPFIKLDAGVLTSTIWTDEPAWKLFQAAMLRAEPTEFTNAQHALNIRTMAPEGWWIPPGWYGFARVSGPWLVAQYRAADPEECWRALARLCSPEPESRSQDFEGRRLARVDGGYIVFNFMKYRDFDHSAADRMRKLRARKKSGVTPNGDAVRPNVTHSRGREQRAEAESVPETSISQESPVASLARREPVLAEVLNWTKEACILWDQRFQGRGAYGKIGSDLKPLVTRHGWEMVRTAWIRYLAAAEAEYASSSRFSQTFGKWSGLAQDPPGKHDITAHNIRAAQEALANPPDLGNLGAAVKSFPRR